MGSGNDSGGEMIKEFSIENGNTSLDQGSDPSFGMEVTRLEQNFNLDLIDLIALGRLKLPYRTQKLIEQPFIEVPNPSFLKNLDIHQRAALDEVVHWIIHPNPADRVLTLGGYAGTGKTLLIRFIDSYLDAIQLPHVVVSLAGKTVDVLRRMAVWNAQTMHSLLYHVDEKVRREQNLLRFIKNDYLRERIIIVDEGQTLTRRALDDFLSFDHVRVILVGDHGQLRPIGESHGLMDQPRLVLETIHRQARHSNVLKVAHAMRQGMMPRYGKAPDVEIAPRNRFWGDIKGNPFDQILVGSNFTRHLVNRAIRQALGRPEELPAAGDRVIGLNNAPDLGIYNGKIFTVSRVSPVSDEIVSLDLTEENGSLYREILCISSQFGRNKIEYSSVRDLNQKYGEVNFFDYAYAITYYKAIGSQWDTVGIYEELYRDSDLRRIAYTAVTRARQGFIYYR